MRPGDKSWVDISLLDGGEEGRRNPLTSLGKDRKDIDRCALREAGQ